MTRLQYLRYLLVRIAKALGVTVLFVAAALAAQSLGLARPANWKPVIRPVNKWSLQQYQKPVIRAPAARMVEWWTYPVLCGLVGYVGFGPKQRRPIYLYYGSRYARAYAGIKQDFNAASRGDMITGATGTGKTQICLNPINESQTVHMRGIERPGWKTSEARIAYITLKRQYYEQTAALRKDLKKAVEHRDDLRKNEYPAVADRFAALFIMHLVRTYQQTNGQSMADWIRLGGSEHSAIEPPEIIGAETATEPEAEAPTAPRPPREAAKDDFTRLARATGMSESLPDVTVMLRVLNESSAAAMTLDRPLQLPDGCPADLVEAGAKWQKARAAVQEAEDRIATIQNQIALRRLELSRTADLLRSSRYQNYPWGGAIFDQKGNCAQQQQPMLERYDRPEDIIVLAVRPFGVKDWAPANRINLLSFEMFPPDTYAKLIVDTYNEVEECDKPDPFFVPKARGAIADAIRLLRAIRDAQLALPRRPDFMCNPSLSLVHSILKDYVPYKPESNTGEPAKPYGGKFYWNFMEQVGAEVPHRIKTKNPNAVPLLNTPEVRTAIDKLRTSYWSQPTDQLGGVAGTADNFLGPFSEPAFEEVFCADNTCQFTDVERGKIFTVSIPQRYAVQRAYVATIISQVLYQIIQTRFDQNKETSWDWNTRNVLRQEKDEAQRLATKADTNTDTIREAQGSTALASQSRPAMWNRFGGKDKAAAPLSNLRNLFICRAAIPDCAEDSAKLIARALYEESSTSGKLGESSSVSVSTKEHYIVSPERLLSLSDFNVIFCPAEGDWLYVQVVPCPVTPEGEVPFWWYGEANPVKLLAWALGLPQKIPKKVLWFIPTGPLAGKKLLWFRPDKIVPFWRAKCWFANKAIGWRYLFGLDTTWYIVDRMSKAQAQRQATHRQHLKAA